MRVLARCGLSSQMHAPCSFPSLEGAALPHVRENSKSRSGAAPALVLAPGFRYSEAHGERAYDLIDLLDLEELEVNIFRGVSPKEDRQRVFGGQVAGQGGVGAGGPAVAGGGRARARR